MALIRLSTIGTDRAFGGGAIERLPLKFGIVVPTLNAGAPWSAWIEALQSQTISPEAVVVIDSSSNDQTRDLAQQADFHVLQIKRQDFDHGGTRQLGVEHLFGRVDVVVLLTQDAELADEYAIEQLIEAFLDERVGCAYGRQIARSTHSAIARHHRQFNYSGESEAFGQADLHSKGLRAAFCSNSFAAYRMSALDHIGGFQVSTIFGEDMLAAVKMMNAGYLKHYVATAVVFHAHDYSVREEFRRYFDMGVMHASEVLLQDVLRAGTTSSGSAFVKSEISSVAEGSPVKAAALLLRSSIRLLGYKAGRQYRLLPNALCQFFAMNKRYFN